MQALETIEHKGHNIKIYQDESAESPREWDNLGTIAAFHRNYNLSDSKQFKSPEEVESYIKKTKAIALPVFMYEHGGIALSTGAFGCPWDSGQVGVIFVEREKVMKEWKVKKISKKLMETILSNLKSEIETYSKYLNGEVYGFVIEKEETCETCQNHKPKVIESLWGFYEVQDAISEAKGFI